MSGLLIDGRWLPGEGGVLHSYNPASGALLWQGAAATEAQVQAALKAARAAWPSWQQLSPDERFVYLQHFNEQVRQQESWLAGLISAETGKPLWESRNELAAMLGKAEISWRAYQSRSGEWQQPMAQGVSHVRHRAHGVMAVFGPYNFPGHLPNGHIMPALLAGNTVVFKPSELTPA
ncbi:MAG: aldehyde dehydrogenase family protein, partial [Plesiomonas shigelloides]